MADCLSDLLRGILQLLSALMLELRESVVDDGERLQGRGGEEEEAAGGGEMRDRNSSQLTSSRGTASRLELTSEDSSNPVILSPGKDGWLDNPEAPKGGSMTEAEGRASEEGRSHCFPCGEEPFLFRLSTKLSFDKFRRALLLERREEERREGCPGEKGWKGRDHQA